MPQRGGRNLRFQLTVSYKTIVTFTLYSFGMTDEEMRLADFKSRGLEEVEVAVTDGLQGIDEAISSSYPAKRQR